MVLNNNKLPAKGSSNKLLKITIGLLLRKEVQGHCNAKCRLTMMVLNIHSVLSTSGGTMLMSYILNCRMLHSLRSSALDSASRLLKNLRRFMSIYKEIRCSFVGTLAQQLVSATMRQCQQFHNCFFSHPYSIWVKAAGHFMNHLRTQQSADFFHVFINFGSTSNIVVLSISLVLLDNC